MQSQARYQLRSLYPILILAILEMLSADRLLIAINSHRWKEALPSNTISVSSPDAFQAAIAQNKLVVVDFFAPWCMACRRLFPALMKLAENNPDIVFIKVPPLTDTFREILGPEISSNLNLLHWV